MKPRSLFGAIIGALVLTGFIPRADAIVISYFNFEHGTVAPFTFAPEKTPPVTPPGNSNTGGGVEPSTSNLVFGGDNLTHFSIVSPGVASNVTTNPPDQDANNFAVNFNSTKGTTMTITFSVNTEFFAGYSLSYATNNNGNGYQTVTLTFTDANGAHSITQANPQTPAGTVVFNLTGFTGLNGDGMTPQFVTFTLTFTNGNSNGSNLQTVIDNVRLDATTFVPEPATVASGLFGVLGLCWHQRRRLIRFTRLRRA